MSIAQALSTPSRASPRWLLFASLALNLFFVGAAAAIFIKGPPPFDRSVSARIERVAATLPRGDAEKLRNAYLSNRPSLEAAYTTYENARDTIRAALRREPFDAEALRATMAQTRTARQNFDQAIQAAVAGAAGEMSQEGRNKLAAYAPRSPNR